MGSNGIISKMRIEHHARRQYYYKVVLEGCLDAIIKDKLKRKITYIQ